MSSRYCSSPSRGSALLSSGLDAFFGWLSYWGGKMGCCQHQAGIQQPHEEMAAFLAVPGQVQGKLSWGWFGTCAIYCWKIGHSQEDAAFWLTMPGHVLPLRLGIDWEWRMGGFLPPLLGAVFRRRWRMLCRKKEEWSALPAFCKGVVATPHPLKMRSQELQGEDSRRTHTNREDWWDSGMVLAFVFKLNTLPNAFGWVEAEEPSSSSLNLPSYLSLPT